MTDQAPRRVRLRDVAVMARVDPAVVSKIVNGSESLSVRPETRARVLEAIKVLNYRPNAMARSLRTARTDTVGLLIPDFTNPIYASIISGAQRAAARRGQLVLTASVEREDSIPLALERLGKGRVDGLLVAEAPASPSAFKEIRSIGLPWLLLNRKTTASHRYLILDDERATRIAVDHLVDLGHRVIAHLAGPSSADTASRRKTGFRAAMAAHGLSLRRQHLVEADYTYEGGFAAMRSLLARPLRPTAVVVANVASAIGALRAAHVTGVTVPAELSVVSIHDLALAAYLDPPLTTVRMPVEELGERGIEIVSTLAPSEEVEEVLGGPMELVIRESTAPPTS